MAISDSLYRFLLSSGIMVGGTGLAWMLMKVIVPTKEDMLKVVLWLLLFCRVGWPNTQLTWKFLKLSLSKFFKKTSLFKTWILQHLEIVLKIRKTYEISFGNPVGLRFWKWSPSKKCGLYKLYYVTGYLIGRPVEFHVKSM